MPPWVLLSYVPVSLLLLLLSPTVWPFIALLPVSIIFECPLAWSGWCSGPQAARVMTGNTGPHTLAGNTWRSACHTCPQLVQAHVGAWTHTHKHCDSLYIDNCQTRRTGCLFRLSECAQWEQRAGEMQLSLLCSFVLSKQCLFFFSSKSSPRCAAFTALATSRNAVAVCVELRRGGFSLDSGC